MRELHDCSKTNLCQVRRESHTVIVSMREFSLKKQITKQHDLK